MHQGQEELEVKAKFPQLGGVFHAPYSNTNPSHEEELHLRNDRNSSLSAHLGSLLGSSPA